MSSKFLAVLMAAGMAALDVPKPVKLRYLHSSPWTGTLFSEVNLPVGAFHIGF